MELHPNIPTIKYEDFTKLDLRVGTIFEASLHPDADKLLVLQVDLGNEKRQIVAGIKKHYPIEKLAKLIEGEGWVGQQIIVVTNLEPRTLRGVVSHGMLLAATSLDDLALIAPEHRIAPGSKVG